MSERKIRNRKLTDYTPDPENPNAHTERGMSLIAKSLETVGLGRSIVTDKHGNILAGNGVTEVAVEKGFEDAIEVETDGNTLVVVKRTDLDLTDDPEHRARLYTYLDNQSAKASIQFVAEKLIAHMQAGVPVNEVFTPEEMEQIIQQAAVQQAAPDAGAQVDRAAELQQKWQVQRGQVWRIGKHKLMCGDSTSADDVARLMDGEKVNVMFADPPYGVDYEGGHFHSGDVDIKRPREKLSGDNNTDIYYEFLPVVLPYIDGACYLWFADIYGFPVYDALRQNNCEIHALIVWNKINATYAAMNAQYKHRHEPCLYFKPKSKTLRWIGATDESTVWDIKRDASNEFHPTQKPVELAIKAISNHEIGIVLDPFCGSGTTLVACEQTGRRGFGMEISPEYCSVILQRLQDMGLKPELDAS